MGFTDEVREYAKRAVDAAKDGTAAARSKGKEFTLKRRQKALAGDLGQIVFRQREGETGLDAEVERLASEMRGVSAEIDALHEGPEAPPEGPEAPPEDPEAPPEDPEAPPG